MYLSWSSAQENSLIATVSQWACPTVSSVISSFPLSVDFICSRTVILFIRKLFPSFSLLAGIFSPLCKAYLRNVINHMKIYSHLNTYIVT